MYCITDSVRDGNIVQESPLMFLVMDLKPCIVLELHLAPILFKDWIGMTEIN